MEKLPDLVTFTAVLSVELDPLGSGGQPMAPGILSREAALDVAEAVADDLRSLAPDIDRFGLVVPGALYDQTQLLRAGFPIVEALEAVFRGGMRDGFAPQLVALGVDDGPEFPVRVLNPEYPTGMVGPLLLMPVTFLGPAKSVSRLGEALEENLLHAGRVSAATRALVERHFRLQPVHLSYATLADLCALLSVQLENAGFLDLWSLLEHAFFDRPDALSVALPEGNLFVLKGRILYTPIYTLDIWQASRRPKDSGMGLDAFLAWTRLQRQYEVTLQAYGLDIRRVLAMGPPEAASAEALWNQLSGGALLGGAWYCEEAAVPDGGERTRRLFITNHSDPALGTVAYTLERFDLDDTLQSRQHFYPLSPDGLQAIADHLTSLADAQGLERMVGNPGRVSLDPHTGLLSGSDPARNPAAPAASRH